MRTCVGRIVVYELYQLLIWFTEITFVPAQFLTDKLFQISIKRSYIEKICFFTATCSVTMQPRYNSLDSCCTTNPSSTCGRLPPMVVRTYLDIKLEIH